PRSAYAAGTAFVPRDRAGREQVLAALARIAEQEGLRLLGTRDLPVTDGLVGPSAEAVRPDMVQVFLADAAGERRGLRSEERRVGEEEDRRRVARGGRRAE